MRLSTVFLSLCLGATLPAVVKAQPAPQPSTTATPDPAVLKAARETVAQMQGDRSVLLGSMAAPMVGLMQQMGIKEPDRARVLVEEVVMPTLTAHYDELLDIQARGYASVLGKADLEAITAFYASATGKRLAAAQPQLAQAQLTGMRQWIGSVMPEMQGKITKAIQAHGWAPSGQGKPH